MPVPRLPLILLGLALWWLVVPLERYIAEDGWRLLSAAPFILLASVGLVFGCFALKRNPLVILLWSPLLILAAWILITLVPEFFGELSVGGMSGGGAPLGGAAMLLALTTIVVTAIIFACGLVAFPRNIHRGILAASLLNSAAIAFTVYHLHDVETRQIITLTVIDSNGKPVPDAAVNYKVFGYGPGGTRPSSPEITGGPLLTDSNGHALLRSRQMYHEVIADIAKAGYLPVEANLGMQYNAYDTQRSLALKIANVTGVASFYVPIQNPQQLTVFLPSAQDGPMPLRFREFTVTLHRGSNVGRFLNVTTGFFTDNPDKADLRFDLSEKLPPDQSNYMRHTEVKITALHDSGVVAVDRTPQNARWSDYETLMALAPREGYTTDCTVRPQYGMQVFFRNADKTRYACLALEMVISPSDNQSTIEGTLDGYLLVNPTGSRNLLFDKSQELH